MRIILTKKCFKCPSTNHGRPRNICKGGGQTKKKHKEIITLHMKKNILIRKNAPIWKKNLMRRERSSILRFFFPRRVDRLLLSPTPCEHPWHKPQTIVLFNHLCKPIKSVIDLFKIIHTCLVHAESMLGAPDLICKHTLTALLIITELISLASFLDATSAVRGTRSTIFH